MQTSRFNRSLLKFFTGGYQLSKCFSIPIRIYSLKDVSLFICTDGISSFRSTWDCTGMQSFNIGHKSTPNETQSKSGETL